jgi:hypothetical protein
MNFNKFVILLWILSSFTACKINYSFSGVNISKDVKTYQVDFFPNNADLIVPGLNDDFRNMLIDEIDQKTNLELVKNNGDLVFQGEITDYFIEPVALTADQTAAQNRLTISIKIDYTNTKNEADDISKTYSWYYDYDASQTRFDVEADAHKEILEHIIEYLFKDTITKW